MKKTRREQNTICWAVNPFEDSNQHHSHALNVLVPIAKALNAKIHPVCYASPLEVYMGPSLAAGLNQVKLKSVLSEAIDKKLKKLVSPSDRDLVSPIHLIVPAKGANPDTVAKISGIDRYAQLIGAKFTAVHSHGKTGLKKFFLGSFAEAAISTSKLPTLLINPASQPQKKIHNIIFPSDFSAESQKSLKLANTLATQMKASLTITHCLRIPELPELLSDKISKAQLMSDLHLLKADLEKRAARFLAQCKQKKVSAQFDLIEVRPNVHPADAIARLAAAKDSSIIIMAAKSGTLRANILGSLSRKISKIATCPILIDRLKK
jgi:nucleotide-binding universal stress UspA family protein